MIDCIVDYDFIDFLLFLDFGFAREACKKSLLETMCGSFSYSAPELISRHEYDGFSADCWSVGVILYCMLCGTLPFKRDELMSLSKGRNVKPLHFHDEVSEGLSSLTLLSLTYRIYPGERPGVLI